MCYIRYILGKPSSPTTSQPRTINDIAKFNSKSQAFNAGQLPAKVGDWMGAVQNRSLPLGANDQLRSIASGFA